MKQTRSAGRLPDLKIEGKARQAAKIEEVRRALIVAGYRTTAEQAFALGVNRSTAWALLNRARKAGPSATVLKHILASQSLPQAVRRKVEEYIKEKSTGRYAHDKGRVRWFHDQFPTIASGDDKRRPSRNQPLGSTITERVVMLTQTDPPAGATHWTSAMMAKVVDISASSVTRIWRAHGLQPHRVKHRRGPQTLPAKEQGRPSA